MARDRESRAGRLRRPRREDPPLRRRGQGRPALQLQRPGRRRRQARPRRLRLRQGQRSAAGRREGAQGRPGNAQAASSSVQLRGETIPHRVIGQFGASRVILVPAGPGTGVKAGPGVRDVLEACGIHNILTKVHGSTNPINLVKATIAGLLRAADARRSPRLRGVTL